MGCGKKGPPLAPFVRIPAAIETIDARRVGHDVYITVTVPAQNVDASTPVDARRVDVYGYTGFAPPARGRFIQDGGVLISTFDVAAAALPGALPPDPPAGPVPGTRVTVREKLAAGAFSPTPPAAPVGGQGAAAQGAAAPGAGATGPAARGVLRRFYMALAFSTRGVPGPPGTVIEVPLTRLPDPPSVVDVTYTTDVLTLTWDAAGGLIALLLDRALPLEPPPFAAALPPPSPVLAEPEGPTLYNVYREIAADPLALPAVARDPLRDAAPAPLNPMPLATLTFSEPIALDERQRCYVVRTVRGVAPNLVEGEPSPRACVTPLDIFAPATPTGLATIASADVISLIWEPVADADLAGYLVLRGEAGGDTLTPLTREAVQEAQYTDETVTPGVRYLYHVIAVDDRLPLPNASAPAIIEDTAR